MQSNVSIKVLNEQGALLGELKSNGQGSINTLEAISNPEDSYRQLFELLIMLRLHSIKMELSVLVFPDSEFDEQKIKSKILNIEKGKKKKELNSLTKKELDVVSLLLSGCTSKLISEKLFISFNTVKTHRRNIFIKTGIKKVTDLNKIFNPLIKYGI